MARRRGKKIDYTRWAAFNSGNNGFGLSATSAGITMASSTSLKTQTLMRTRGEIIGWIDGNEASAVAVLVSVGLQLVPAGTGTTVLTDPFGESAASWFYHQEFVLGYEEYVTDVIDAPILTCFRGIVDSKAMRILRPEEEVQSVITNTTLSGAASVNVHMAGRFLFGE